MDAGLGCAATAHGYPDSGILTGMPTPESPFSLPWYQPLINLGFAAPTEVQKAVWEPFTSGRDLIVQSGTGTGKTLAYLLPLFAAVDTQRRDLQALILVPTQELAVQIRREIDKLAQGTAVRSLVLMGGVNLARQVELLKDKPHLVVGTPGRVLELLEKKKITGHYLTSVVLDEGDRLFDAATLPTLRAILKTTLKSRQTTLFSASVPPPVEAAAREFLKDPVVLRLDPEVPIPPEIAHWWFASERRDKADLLRKLLHALQPQRTLVFLNRPEQIEMVADKLRHHGVSAESLHGALFKSDRQRALEGFAKGSVAVLVASDLAARGLHIEGVTHVIHFDVPEAALDYQHRCGRTGRAGQKGLSLALADELEAQRLHAFEKAFGIEVQSKVLRQGTVYDQHRG
jgi:superfamily II DNA/RNA helicase